MEHFRARSKRSFFTNRIASFKKPSTLFFLMYIYLHNYLKYLRCYILTKLFTPTSNRLNYLQKSSKWENSPEIVSQTHGPEFLKACVQTSKLKQKQVEFSHSKIGRVGAVVSGDPGAVGGAGGDDGAVAAQVFAAAVASGVIVLGHDQGDKRDEANSGLDADQVKKCQKTKNGFSKRVHFCRARLVRGQSPTCGLKLGLLLHKPKARAHVGLGFWLSLQSRPLACKPGQACKSPSLQYKARGV
jgi:hypothetical protein